MTSKHKGVTYINNPQSVGQKRWLAKFTYKGKTSQSTYETEIEAAKVYDLMRIKVGKDPVNILKRKI